MTETDQPISVPPSFRIIAHRGASGYAPENTMAAFDLAKQMGATEIEFDIQFSQDQQLMICHDPELSRYGHPNKRVSELTMKELKALDIGSWFGDDKHAGATMLTLDELFSKYANQFIFHAEIKTPAPGLGMAILESITTHKLTEQVIVTSFHFDALTEFASLGPPSDNIPLGWLVRENAFTDDNIQRAADAGFHQFCPLAQEVTNEQVKRAHELISEIRVHRIKTKEDMRRTIDTGCDGLTINWPDWLTH